MFIVFWEGLPTISAAASTKQLIMWLKIGTAAIQNYLYLEIFLRLGQKQENDCRYNAGKPSNKDGGQDLTTTPMMVNFDRGSLM